MVAVGRRSVAVFIVTGIGMEVDVEVEEIRVLETKTGVAEGLLERMEVVDEDERLVRTLPTDAAKLGEERELRVVGERLIRSPAALDDVAKVRELDDEKGGLELGEIVVAVLSFLVLLLVRSSVQGGIDVELADEVTAVIKLDQEEESLGDAVLETST